MHIDERCIDFDCCVELLSAENLTDHLLSPGAFVH